MPAPDADDDQPRAGAAPAAATAAAMAAALRLWAIAEERAALTALAGAGVTAGVLSSPSLAPGPGAPAELVMAVAPAGRYAAARGLEGAGFTATAGAGRWTTFVREGFRVRLAALGGIGLEEVPAGSAVVPPVSRRAGLLARIGPAARPPAGNRSLESVREWESLLRSGAGAGAILGRGARVRTVDGCRISIPEGVCAPSAWAPDLLAAWCEAADRAAADRAAAGGAAPATPLLVDVGTGSGVMAILAARRLPGARIIATDRSPRALRAARRNAARAGVAAGIELRYGDLAAALPAGLRGRVHAVVENLPSVWPRGFDAVRWRDPGITVEGVGADGADLIRALARDIRPFLAPGAGLVMPLRTFQWEILEAEFAAMGYGDATVRVPHLPTSVLVTAWWSR